MKGGGGIGEAGIGKEVEEEYVQKEEKEKEKKKKEKASHFLFIYGECLCDPNQLRGRRVETNVRGGKGGRKEGGLGGREEHKMMSLHLRLAYHKTTTMTM